MSFSIDNGQILLSLEDDKYFPLPRVGDFIKKGQVFAKLKHLSNEGLEAINIESKDLICPYDCEIVNIEI